MNKTTYRSKVMEDLLAVNLKRKLKSSSRLDLSGPEISSGPPTVLRYFVQSSIRCSSVFLFCIIWYVHVFKKIVGVFLPKKPANNEQTS